MNTYEIQAWISVQALLVQVEGMKAENQQRLTEGKSLAYTEENFCAMADAISAKIHEL